MIMSLLCRPTKRQRCQETIPRRQETKLPPQGETKLEPSGVATFITVDWRFQLIAQGDRHDMSSIKKNWEQYFKDKAPYQVYTIPDERLFIQYSEVDEVIRIEFSDEQVGNAIREHAKSKKWIWRDNISNIEIVQICRHFTRLLNDQTDHRIEISRGAKEDVDNNLEDAAKREIKEEFGITDTENLTYVADYPFYRKNRLQYTRCYHLNISSNDAQRIVANSKTLSNETNWFCPFPFYRFLFEEEQSAEINKFAEIKARHETRNIRASDLNESLWNLDEKLKQFILGKIIFQGETKNSENKDELIRWINGE